MTRRLPLAAASVAVAALLTSGCSTFSRNDAAAEVNGHELAINDFEAILGDLGGAPDALGDFPGTGARQLLTAWVSLTALQDELARQGIVIDDAARQEAEQRLDAADQASVDAGNAPQVSTWSAPTKDLQVNYRAMLDAIAKSDDLIPESQLEAAYNAGHATSGVLCLRLMSFATVTEAQDAFDALQSGAADFATLAEDHPIDPSVPANGGIFSDPNTGAECLSTESYPGLGEALGTSVVGEVSGPLTLGNSTVLFIERPYAEVAEQLRPILGPAIAGDLSRSLVSGIHANIDSRYGMWDDSVGQVVPTR